MVGLSTKVATVPGLTATGSSRKQGSSASLAGKLGSSSSLAGKQGSSSAMLSGSIAGNLGVAASSAGQDASREEDVSLAEEQITRAFLRRHSSGSSDAAALAAQEAARAAAELSLVESAAQKRGTPIDQAAERAVRRIEGRDSHVGPGGLPPTNTFRDFVAD